MSSSCPPAECANRLLLLRFGAERVPRRLSLAEGPALLCWLPIQGALVETADGWVLLETGIGPAVAASASAQEGYAAAAAAEGLGSEDAPEATLWPGGPDGSWCWGRGLDAVLADHDLTVAELRLAAVSHLHLDHTGGLPLLARAGVPVAIQAAELAFGETEAAVQGGYVRSDVDGHPIDWRPLDGDARLAPGVHALFTPGHTPGHMSYRVELPQTGSWILAIDAADFGQNLLDVGLPGAHGGTAADTRASLLRLVTEANARGARLLPGHDALAFSLAGHPPGGHR